MSTGASQAIRLTVRGRVQGVGFRWFIASAARSLDLVGHVRNRDDGAVEIVAKGASPALDSLVEQARCGPPGSRVDGVEQTEIDSCGAIAGFEVRF